MKNYFENFDLMKLYPTIIQQVKTNQRFRVIAVVLSAIVLYKAGTEFGKFLYYISN
jgi:hypothetical protein